MCCTSLQQAHVHISKLLQDKSETHYGLALLLHACLRIAFRHCLCIPFCSCLDNETTFYSKSHHFCGSEDSHKSLWRGYGIVWLLFGFCMPIAIATHVNRLLYVCCLHTLFPYLYPGTDPCASGSVSRCCVHYGRAFWHACAVPVLHNSVCVKSLWRFVCMTYDEVNPNLACCSHTFTSV